jgi:hypothetical protein
VLGLQEIHGRHTGENQAVVIIRVIAGFGIASQLGSFMIDNATNNDTMIAALSVMLLDEYNIEYNAIHHRVRCNGYIIVQRVGVCAGRSQWVKSNVLNNLAMSATKD